MVHQFSAYQNCHCIVHVAPPMESMDHPSSQLRPAENQSPTNEFDRFTLMEYIEEEETEDRIALGRSLSCSSFDRVTEGRISPSVSGYFPQSPKTPRTSHNPTLLSRDCLSQIQPDTNAPMGFGKVWAALPDRFHGRPWSMGISFLMGFAAGWLLAITSRHQYKPAV